MRFGGEHGVTLCIRKSALHYWFLYLLERACKSFMNSGAVSIAKTAVLEFLLGVLKHISMIFKDCEPNSLMLEGMVRQDILWKRLFYHENNSKCAKLIYICVKTTLCAILRIAYWAEHRVLSIFFTFTIFNVSALCPCFQSLSIQVQLLQQTWYQWTHTTTPDWHGTSDLYEGRLPDKFLSKCIGYDKAHIKNLCWRLNGRRLITRLW